MYSFKKDSQYLKTGVPELKDFLLSSEVFWPLGGDLPQLTIGGILFALTRLSAIQPTEAQKIKLEVDSLKEKWRSAWERKASREVQNRLRLWSEFLVDYRNASRQNADWYTNEVRWRAMLALLLKEAPSSPEAATLDALDESLRAGFLHGEFIWDKELRPVFPEKDFWFLYGKLKP